MTKKIKLELTEYQFSCLIDIVDEYSSMGISDNSINTVKAVDIMLKKNGYKRNFN